MESNKRKKIEASQDTDSDIEIIEPKKNLKDTKTTEKTKCKYGKNCYRKNPAHFEEFYHDSNDEGEDTTDVARPSKLIKLDNFDSATGSRLFLTKVNIKNAESINANYSLSLKEILSFNQDDFVESAQFNYMLDINWLVENYPIKNQNKKLTLIYGQIDLETQQVRQMYPNIRLIKAKLDSMYGTHHTKMMFLLYKTGLRIVIHTANLIECDWNQKTQGLWISDLFPPIDKSKNSNFNSLDSKTNFKKYLITYLEYYNDKNLNDWIEHIKWHDMTSANVFLIASVPGRFPSTKKIFGHMRLRKILGDYFSKLDQKEQSNENDQLIAQFSSIGSLGPTENNWLCKEFSASLASSQNPSNKTNKPKLIYPSVENVRLSYEGYSAGGSLPYSKTVAMKQQYLKNFFYKWNADATKRTKASPHIKSYLRCSADYKKIYWFLLTSANLSKAAWGTFEKNESQYFIRSYEIGVLFLPSLMNNNSKNYFEENEFLIPYDLPPVKYDDEDEPWIYDLSYVDKIDTHGRIYKIQ